MPPGSVWETCEIYKKNDETESGWDLIDFVGAPTTSYQEAILASENFINVVENVEVCYKVRPVGSTGEAVDLVDVPETCITLVGDQLAPGAVKSFSLNVRSETILLTWEAPDEIQDLGYFILKYTPDTGTSATWNHANTFIPFLSHDSSSVEVPVRIGQYFLKIVDSSGNASAEYGRTITTIPELLNVDLIEKIFPEPLWEGTKQQTEVVGDELRLVNTRDTYPPEGIYEYNKLIDLGDIYTVRINNFITGYGYLAGSFMSQWNPLSSVLRLYDVKEGDWRAIVEVKTSDGDLSMSRWDPLSDIDPLAEGQVDFTEWRELHSGDFVGRIFQFRLRLLTIKENVTPSITSGFIEVDVPERFLSDNDIICPVGGMRVDFLPAFIKPPSLAMTFDSAQENDRYVITNKDKWGFNIEFFDKNNLSVSRQFDYTALGYAIHHTEVI
jgi:hypothetical protein